MSKYSIGVDIGTTSTKAVLFSETGEIMHQSTVEYPLSTPEPKAAVQDPDEIVEAVVVSVKSLVEGSAIDQKHISVMSFSSAMHSLIAVNINGQPLTPSITWADQRAEQYAKALKITNGHSIYEKTGTPIHPMSPLSKIIWMREEEPEIFKHTYKFIGIKEYVFYRFFNRYVIDYSVASATGLLNMYELNWDEEALSTAQITKDQLSSIVPTTEVFTDLNETLAKAMGIDPNTPIVIGANDGCLANLGVNAIDKGTVAITIGTSGAIRTVVNEPVTDPGGRIFCYALTENHWVVGGPVNNGGMILRWLRDELCVQETNEAAEAGENAYNLITEKISRVRPGSNGLIFHPYLSGERAPSWNANARGSFYGLALHHKREDMMRAVLEGINLNLYMVMLALEDIIGRPEKIHATGGFAQSEVWRQMLADIFNQEVHIPQTVESACLGASILGRFAIGELEDLLSVRNLVKTESINKPQPESVMIYEELIPIYSRLSRLFEQEYDAITDFQAKFR